MKYQAKAQCDLLLNPNGVFKTCLEAIEDETFFYRKCLQDYCYAAKRDEPNAINNALCSAFDAMSQECSDNFVNVLWRSKNRCRKFKF